MSVVVGCLPLLMLPSSTSRHSIARSLLSVVRLDGLLSALPAPVTCTSGFALRSFVSFKRLHNVHP